MSKRKRYQNFAEFWPFYLSQHSHPATKVFHLLGFLLAVLALTWAIASGKFIFALLAPVLGYLPAWFSHFVIEKNRPATFRYPLYSFRGDIKMCQLMLTNPGWLTRNLSGRLPR